MNKKKRLERVKRLLAEKKCDLNKKYNVKEIGIFGSYIRGEEKKSSDIDILVEFEKPIDFFLFLELEEELEKLLGIKVDLVRRKALKPFIREQILKEVVYV